MSRTILFTVTGMTCTSCERFVQSVLQSTTGVIETEVSLKQARAGIRMADDAVDLDIALLNDTLRARGYALRLESTPADAACALPKQPSDVRRRLRRAALALIGVSILMIFFEPLRRIVPTVSAGASFGALFVFGLVASLSTCLATTGAFLLAYQGKSRSPRELVSVHAGRMTAFVLGGGLLGFIGGSIPAAGALTYGMLGLALGVLFLAIGLNLLELAPTPARLGLLLPKQFHALGDRVASSTHPAAPFLVGAVTFLLPCGFTQTAQSLALASGSARSGALMLLAFALGTLPVLAGISTMGLSRIARLQTVKLATGAALVLFAFGQFNGGLTVLGSPITPGTIVADVTGRLMDAAAIPTAHAQEQVVRMTVAYGTYQPKHLTIRKKIPVRWEIDGKDVSGCASSLVAPALGITRELSPGQNVIQFTATSAGTIPFSCAMGMIRGSFTVTD